MIAVVDVGLCNAGSICNMLKVLGAEAVRTADPELIKKARKLILPGIGAFDAGRRRLDESGLVPLLNRRVMEEGVPVLGICLGMQLMTENSEEGSLPGLGWIGGATRRFSIPPAHNLRVPHMGWNQVAFRSDCDLARHLDRPRFYFVHSSHVVLRDEENDWAGRATYGYPFVCAFARGNVYGVQFHPEKSHRFGLQLLRNFSELTIQT